MNPKLIKRMKELTNNVNIAEVDADFINFREAAKKSGLLKPDVIISIDNCRLTCIEKLKTYQNSSI